jgi:hypothetical protein
VLRLSSKFRSGPRGENAWGMRRLLAGLETASEGHLQDLKGKQ